jgi:hypothetical protein
MSFEPQPHLSEKAESSSKSFSSRYSSREPHRDALSDSSLRFEVACLLFSHLASVFVLLCIGCLWGLRAWLDKKLTLDYLNLLVSKSSAWRLVSTGRKAIGLGVHGCMYFSLTSMIITHLAVDDCVLAQLALT